MFKRLFGLFSNDLAIDLGTANTLIYVRNKGVILDEPSVVAIRNTGSGPTGKDVLAVGQEAKLMLGRTPGNISAIRPMKDGVIADFTITEVMLKYFIRKVQENRLFASPRIIISVPCGSTQVERRAIRESAASAGAREVYLIEEPMAVAIGADLPIAEPTGSMVVDIGGGTTEVGVISLGGMVYSQSLRVAGDTFDDAIQHYIRRRHGLLIGEATSERVKNQIGCAWSKSEKLEMEIKGRDVAEGLTRSLNINSSEIFDAISDALVVIVQAVRQALERTPPELSADISDRGMVLGGGGALLRDFDRRLMDETGMPVIVAEDPLTCVARGAGHALDEMDRLGEVFSRE
ncbi:MAG: rod shape-determining protein [Arenicellales bacterium]|jgi:rod shape-determining protein MreB|nr:rod shape-determining protein [Acidiferrobacteraceae bacterium]MDP6123318.1 rod shape-determining protein [Arenicellales bacterium]MBT58201.1 rod shape-determining protein [Acidiferrobacteraceae bacterium]MDP6290002.1 rod shape-determining protein [Arenicellales bacterium]MDP6434046.1 rod shape-determining protein [Arenicellales bacterium]|tara:strand:- start:3291 stop:4331 length:1041 start_codon:yes stop_codon:yes gene_type:complete